jgi:hypothetical protein
MIDDVTLLTENIFQRAEADGKSSYSAQICIVQTYNLYKLQVVLNLFPESLNLQQSECVLSIKRRYTRCLVTCPSRRTVLMRVCAVDADMC